MSSTKLYYCMQAHKGIHCSLSEFVANRIQCDTCHEYEREEAAEKAKLYAKQSRDTLGIDPKDDSLASIAYICQSLTYGEMIELGRQIYSWSTTEVTSKPIDEESLVKLIHKWSKNYGMDSNVNSSGDAITNVVSRIDDLIKSEKKEQSTMVERLRE